MRRVFHLTALLSAIAAFAQAQTDRPALPGGDILPEGTVQLSPVVPTMGEHWGNPADMPLGPIYCVHNGEVVCLEYMIAQEDFESGKSWHDLAGIPGLPSVDHLNILFEENGHEGFEVPHYDLHMYFVTPEEVAAIR